VNPSEAVVFLHHHPVVERAAAALREAGVTEAYLVGGAVRDALRGLGEETRDLDLALPTDPSVAAEALARAFGAAVVPLDEATTRLVFQESGGGWRVDVARYRGPTIRDDLLLRDFTVDAMAVPLLGGGPPALLDPAGGRADLRLRFVRHVYPAAFADDPLRTLRAVRLAAVLDGGIAPETQPLIRHAAAGLARVAGERIRDEVMKVFGAPDAARWAGELEGLGLLAVLVPASAAMEEVPASPPHRLDLWEHSLEVLRLQMRLLESWASLWFPADAAEIRRRADEPVEGEIPRRSLLGLFALLHDVGKPSTRSVEPDGRVRFLGHVEAGAAILAELAGRLRLGRRAAEFLDRMERAHMRPILLAAEPSITPRARYRFFRDLGPIAVDVLLHSLADVGGTAGAVAAGGTEWTGNTAWWAHVDFVREMLAFRRERMRPVQEAPPLTGDEVMAVTGIGPGPLVGHVLERVAEAAALGQARSRAECVELVRREFAAWRREFEEAPDGHSSPTKTP
jgi:putative nucleotidyltransferase with HDIG domain